MNLFHISENYFDNKYFNITAPLSVCNNFVTMGLEDGYIKRTCFSSSITKCITAMGRPVENNIYNVYIPEHIDVLKLVNNEQIIKNKYAIDAKITDETWLLHPTRAIHIGQIRVGEVIKEDKFTIDFINNSRYGKEFTYYKYDWSFIK